MRIDKAIEDGSLLRERGARRRAFERGRERPPARPRLPRRRPLPHRPPARAACASRPRRPGSTRSPTAATSRRTPAVDDLAELPTERIATVGGRYYAMDRDGRWERTRARVRRDRRRRGRTGDRSRSPPSRRATTRGVTDEFIEPVVYRGHARGSAGATRAIFFNFRPDRARQLSRAAARRRLRPDDDDALPRRPRLPGRVRRAGRARDDRRGARRSRHPAAPRRRDREVRARHVLLQRRPRGASGRARTRILVPSPRDVAHLRPEAGDVGGRGRRRGSSSAIETAATASRSSTSPTRTWSGTRASIPAVVDAVETTDRCLGRVVAAVERQGGVALVTADHGNAEQMLDAGRRQPAHGPHDEPRAARRHRRRGRRCATGGELSDLAPTCLELLGVVRHRPLMTGRSTR